MVNDTVCSSSSSEVDSGKHKIVSCPPYKGQDLILYKKTVTPKKKVFVARNLKD